jgi:hypothetical protein
MAYRFWGDALLAQGKLKDAGEKYIEAMIADPYSRFSWDNLNRLAQKYERPFDVKVLMPPGSETIESVIVDVTKLSLSDGTENWKIYNESREAWRRGTFSKEFPNTPYRHSLKEEVAALNATADAATRATNNGVVKTPHHSIANLLELRKRGFIEPFVLLMMPDDGIAQDYLEYRGAHRDVLRKFLSEYVLVF